MGIYTKDDVKGSRFNIMMIIFSAWRTTYHQWTFCSYMECHWYFTMWVSRWVSGWMSEWVSEYVSRWVSEWVGEWVSG